MFAVVRQQVRVGCELVGGRDLHACVGDERGLSEGILWNSQVWREHEPQVGIKRDQAAVKGSVVEG